MGSVREGSDLPPFPGTILIDPPDLQLAVDGFVRGIDNYRIDVQLSPMFVYQASLALDELFKRALASKSLPQSRDGFYDKLKSAYLDMMRLLIHRTKTDLTPEKVQFLQFAIIKHVLQQSRKVLDRNVEELKASASHQMSSGSAKLLDTHDKIVWLNKRYGSILYAVNQQVFKQMLKVELAELREDREHYLGNTLPEAVEIMYNPLLQAELPQDDILLLDQFALWGKSGAKFTDLNTRWEQVLRNYSEFVSVVPVKSTTRLPSGETAVYDEMGGLFAVQPLLGTAEKQDLVLRESLSWMELPDNIRHLFDTSLDAQYLKEIRKKQGFSGWWSYRGKRRKLNNLLRSINKHLHGKKRYENILASYELRDLWSKQLSDFFEPRQVCELIAGSASKKVKKIVADLPEEQKHLGKQIREAALRISKRKSEHQHGTVIRTLTDLTRFRQQLKYFRFAHRVFNRIAILSSEEDIEMSRHGGQLYRLFNASEIEEDEPKIVHHAILKADVRGSTTVTRELVQKSLNPASYFSQRFFDPVNVLLETYGAGKVFIEGDAVILSLMEYKETPQQWFAASRACGLAREMVHVVEANNSHSQRVGLPNLEIGIGICFSADAPMFLFDDGKPIMISPSISDADRMSSCSWKMREKFKGSHFNVEVCDIADGEQEKGEKGQHKILYNVNGILLDEQAVEKVRSEIKLRKLTLKVGGNDEELLVGRFPDVSGKIRTLVIRQARVGLWKNEQVTGNPDSDEYFYEVVSSRKVLGYVNEKLRA